MIEQHGEAIEYDLLGLGLDLSDLGNGLTYGRLALVLANLPRNSAYARSTQGEPATWSITDYLLAHVVDLLAAANWQRGGGKGKKPKAIKRPGMEDQNGKKARIGSGKGRSLAEMREWRKRRRA